MVLPLHNSVPVDDLVTLGTHRDHLNRNTANRLKLEDIRLRLHRQDAEVLLRREDEGTRLPEQFAQALSRHLPDELRVRSGGSAHARGFRAVADDDQAAAVRSRERRRNQLICLQSLYFAWDRGIPLYLEMGVEEAIVQAGDSATATLLGRPDSSQLSLTELSEMYSRLADATELPILADADTGFGNVTNVARTVRLYEKAGVDPSAGCLPTLLTLPVFWGLYRALTNVAASGDASGAAAAGLPCAATSVLKSSSEMIRLRRRYSSRISYVFRRMRRSSS